MFNSNQAFLLVQLLKSVLKDFTLGVKAEIEKKLFHLPQGINKCLTLWLCIGPKAEKGKLSNLGSQFRANVPTFINILTSMF